MFLMSLASSARRRAMSSREGVVKQPGAAQLGIGTTAFAPGYSLGGDAPSRSECARLLRDAISAGIRYLDTAPAYAEAENIIGDVADLVQSAGVRVCTKIASNVRDPRAMRDSLAGSLA